METFLCCLLFFRKTEHEPIISFPNEILEETISEILARLPIKTLLQFKSVSKQWLSIINNPSFARLHLTCATARHRTALLFSAYNKTTAQRHFLSTTRDGGPATCLLTLDAHTTTKIETTEVEHLNGLVLFTSGNGFVKNNFAFVVNPSTRKIFKLPGPASVRTYMYGKVHICYFFGFDELTYEHKILNIRMLDNQSLTPFKPKNIEIMIFSMSNYSWRNIDVDLPFDVCGDHWFRGTKHSVCVNSVIHVMLQSRNKILTFDLKTERFSIINLPREAIPHETHKRYYNRGFNTVKSNHPIIMKINGSLGVICHEQVVERKEMCIWILQDYENHVWVRELVTFSPSWFLLNGPFPLNPILWKVVTASQRLTTDIINVTMYDVETKNIKEVKFTLDHQFLNSNYVRFDHVRSYDESILSLEKN